MLRLHAIELRSAAQPLFERIDHVFEPGLVSSIRKTGVLDGSSALLKCCAGIVMPSAGHVSWNDRAVAGMKSGERFRTLSYCFENGGLVSLFTVFNNIAIPLRYHGICDNEEEVYARVYAAMERLDILDLQQADPHQLNDVQTKLVNLARALAADVSVILIDEIQSGMSSRIYTRVVDCLQACALAGKTIVMVTTLGDDDAFADRHLRIENRELVTLS